MTSYQSEPLWKVFAYEQALARAEHFEAQAAELAPRVQALQAERQRLTRVSKVRMPWMNCYLQDSPAWQKVEQP